MIQVTAAASSSQTGLTMIFSQGMPDPGGAAVGGGRQVGAPPGPVTVSVAGADAASSVPLSAMMILNS